MKKTILDSKVDNNETFVANWNKGKRSFNHHKNIPESFRMLIVGSSGCGKTNLLFNMLLIPKYLDYDNLIIFSKTINQPEYQLLYHGLKNNLSKQSIINIFKNQDSFPNEMTIKEICETYSLMYEEDNKIEVTMFDKIDQIMNPSDLNKNKKNLIIFDDCVNIKNQNVMESYYTRGRHNNCNCIYLSQSWFELPKRSIRNNSNLIILFELGKRDSSLIYSDLLSTIIEKNEWDILSNHHWNSGLYTYLFLS